MRNESGNMEGDGVLMLWCGGCSWGLAVLPGEEDTMTPGVEVVVVVVLLELDNPARFSMPPFCINIAWVAAQGGNSVEEHVEVSK